MIFFNEASRSLEFFLSWRNNLSLQAAAIPEVTVALSNSDSNAVKGCGDISGRESERCTLEMYEGATLKETSF